MCLWVLSGWPQYFSDCGSVIFVSLKQEMRWTVAGNLWLPYGIFSRRYKKDILFTDQVISADFLSKSLHRSVSWLWWWRINNNYVVRESPKSFDYSDLRCYCWSSLRQPESVFPLKGVNSLGYVWHLLAVIKWTSSQHGHTRPELEVRSDLRKKLRGRRESWSLPDVFPLVFQRAGRRLGGRLDGCWSESWMSGALLADHTSELDWNHRN